MIVLEDEDEDEPRASDKPLTLGEHSEGTLAVLAVLAAALSKPWSSPSLVPSTHGMEHGDGILEESRDIEKTTVLYIKCTVE